MTLLTHGGSLLWALLVVWHAVGKGGSLLWALLCGVREARQHTVARRRALTVFSIVRREIPFFRVQIFFTDRFFYGVALVPAFFFTESGRPKNAPFTQIMIESLKKA